MAATYPILPIGVWLCALALLALVLAYFAIFLSHADVESAYAKLHVPRFAATTKPYLTQRRRLFELMSDATVASAAYYLAFQLRFDANLSVPQERNLVRGVPVVILAAVGAQWLFGLYRVFWKYIGATEVIAIAKSACLAAFILFVMTHFSLFGYYPRSIYILFGILFFLLATGYRASLRLMHEWRKSSSGGNGRRVLIIGAGDAGELALRDLRNRRREELPTVCGFLDDDPQKIGLRIHGVAVLAPTTAIATLAAELRVQDVVLAMPAAPTEVRRRIARLCADNGIRVRLFQMTAPAAGDGAEPFASLP
jgi:FlaA1/EpsC-like NDP-sugar epimerase